MINLPANIISNRMAYLDSNAKPLALGRLVIYKSRNTSTGLALVYSDVGLTKLLENPVMLDTDGRTNSELYAEGSVYVRVEKYVGKDEYGENLYCMVYDFETPPSVDISQFWNVNYVETYEQLRAMTNKNPTWVTGEGNPHLYVFNPQKPEYSLDEVIDVSSDYDPSGSWYWETKEVYADQAGISKFGEIYNTHRWITLSNLSSLRNKKIIIPPGQYDFGNEYMVNLGFNDLEIMANVVFLKLANLNISIDARVECYSENLPITWTRLPLDRLYDIRYFAKILQNKVTFIDDKNYINITSDTTYCKSVECAYDMHCRNLKIDGYSTIDGNSTVKGNLTVNNMKLGDITQTNGREKTFSAINITENPSRINDTPIENFLIEYYPIGSYLIGKTINTSGQLNVKYFIDKNNYQSQLDAIVVNNSSDVALHTDRFVFIHCGHTGHEIIDGSHHYKYHLLKRIL